MFVYRIPIDSMAAMLAWNDSRWTSRLPKHQGFGKKYLVDIVGKLHFFTWFNKPCMPKPCNSGKCFHHSFSKGPPETDCRTSWANQIHTSLEKQNAARPSAPMTQQKKMILVGRNLTNLFQLVSLFLWLVLTWDATPPSSSDHQDDITFVSRESLHINLHKCAFYSKHS